MAAVLLTAFSVVPVYAEEADITPEEYYRIMSEQKINQSYDPPSPEDIEWNKKFDIAAEKVHQAYQQYYADEIDFDELLRVEQEFDRKLDPEDVPRRERTAEEIQAKRENLEAYKKSLGENPEKSPAALSAYGDGEDVYLPMPYEYQSTPYNCGPATAVNIVNGYGHTSITQSYAAAQLGTTVNGTNFGNNWKNILNYSTMRKGYSLAYGSSYSNWVMKLAEKSIRTMMGGRGVALDTYMSTGTDYLPGYSGGNVWHYVAAYGFDSTNPSARWIRYIDPNGYNPSAAGAKKVPYQLMGRVTKPLGIVY